MFIIDKKKYIMALPELKTTHNIKQISLDKVVGQQNFWVFFQIFEDFRTYCTGARISL
jgi:hypothetical protein